MESYEKTVRIPSNGYFGNLKEITLRAMTTKEEKILLTSRDFSVFKRLISSCCIKPKDLDIDLLHQNDIMYLIYALRQLTFGDTYVQESKCPECGANNSIEINISEMDVDFLDTDNIEEKLKVKLPVNGDTLQLKLLSSGDNEKLDRIIKQKSAKGRLQDPDSYRITLGLMELIVSRNDEDFKDEEEKRNYVDNLHMKDLLVINNAINKVSNFGLDNNVIRVCENCGEEITVAGIICPEFFRPSI